MITRWMRPANVLVVKVETRGEQRRTEEQPNQVFHHLVRFVSRGFLSTPRLNDPLGKDARRVRHAGTDVIQHSIPPVSSSRTRPQGPILLCRGLELLAVELFQLLLAIFERTFDPPKGGRPSPSPRPSSSSILRPSLIIRWMRPADCVGRQS